MKITSMTFLTADDPILQKGWILGFGTDPAVPVTGGAEESEQLNFVIEVQRDGQVDSAVSSDAPDTGA